LFSNVNLHGYMVKPVVKWQNQYGEIFHLYIKFHILGIAIEIEM